MSINETVFRGERLKIGLYDKIIMITLDYIIEISAILAFSLIHNLHENEISIEVNIHLHEKCGCRDEVQQHPPLPHNGDTCRLLNFRVFYYYSIYLYMEMR